MLMNENHSQKISEEQLDKLIQMVLHSTILTDEEVEDIAAAPRLRRQVQSRIADEKARRERRWFFGWHWQTAAAGALATLIAAGVFVWILNSPKTEIANVTDEKTIVPTEEIKSSETKFNETKFEAETKIISPIVQPKKSSVKPEKLVSKTSPKIKSIRVQSAFQKIAKRKDLSAQKTEAATEFIALSYLPQTESGQVVRVKVPRSIMVSLGVTTNAENTGKLVNAEVIVGDDGAARAIRFLGQ